MQASAARAHRDSELTNLPHFTCPLQLVVLADPTGPGLTVPGIRVRQRCKGGSALRRAATPRAYNLKGPAPRARKRAIKQIRYWSAMAAQEDSLHSPITAAADRSESTTLLESEGSGLPRALQPNFDDGARPPPLALLAQVLESIAGQEIPVSPVTVTVRRHPAALTA